MNAVEITEYWWRYPTFTKQENPWTLQGINLKIEKGEFFGITGSSGAGKTTTCLSILGFIPHCVKIPGSISNHVRGKIKVLGNEVTRVEADKVKGAGVLSPRVGLVMQDPENQFLRMTVLHELTFGLQLMGLSSEEIERRARDALEMVGLGKFWDVADLLHPMDLSGGEKQRVAIASFLAMRPEVLILDEPTSDLDPRGKSDVIRTVEALKREYELTIILVEHNPEVLSRFSDRIALIEQGKVITVDEPREFYSKMELLTKGGGVYTSEIARIAYASGIEYHGRIPISIDEGVKVLSPKVSGFEVSEPVLLETETLIDAQNLWFRYEDGTIALRGVDLSVRRGEYVAIIGPNGSGKTTFSKVLNGIYAPWKGTVKILGQDVRDPKVRSQLPRFVGYVFQNPDHQIFTRRVYDEVAYGLKNLGLGGDEMHRRVYESLETVGLVDKVDEDPLFLGKGERQKLAVAAVLAMKPEILIVDEPTTGQDCRMCEDLMSFLDKLNEQGKTILIITHNMTLVGEHCKRAVVFLDGRTIFDGTPRQLFSNSEILEKTSLTAPQAVRLSIEMRRRDPDFPLLLNVREWIEAIHYNPLKSDRP